MKKFVTLAALAALAACNSGTTVTTQNGQKITIDGDDGDSTMSVKTKDGEFNVQAGPNTKVALPAGFTLYPGAQVISNATMSGNGAQTAAITMNSKASMDQVVTFYRKQAAAAGIDIATEMKTGNAVMLGGENKAGTVFVLNASPADSGGTTASLTLSHQ